MPHHRTHRRPKRSHSKRSHAKRSHAKRSKAHKRSHSHRSKAHRSKAHRRKTHKKKNPDSGYKPSVHNSMPMCVKLFKKYKLTDQKKMIKWMNHNHTDHADARGSVQSQTLQDDYKFITGCFANRKKIFLAMKSSKPMKSKSKSKSKKKKVKEIKGGLSSKVHNDLMDLMVGTGVDAWHARNELESLGQTIFYDLNERGVSMQDIAYYIAMSSMYKQLDIIIRDGSYSTFTKELKEVTEFEKTYGFARRLKLCLPGAAKKITQVNSKYHGINRFEEYMKFIDYYFAKFWFDLTFIKEGEQYTDDVLQSLDRLKQATNRLGIQCRELEVPEAAEAYKMFKYGEIRRRAVKLKRGLVRHGRSKKNQIMKRVSRMMRSNEEDHQDPRQDLHR